MCNFYLSSKAEIIINESEIDDVFESVYSAIISNTQKSLRKGSGWIIDSIINHTIRISNYNPVAGSSYIKLPKELDHPRIRLTEIQNIDDDECLKWSIVRYLNPANHKLARITKADKNFAKKVNFKVINFPVKIRDIHEIEKNNSIGINVFGSENTEKHPIYVSKKICEEKHVDLLLIGEEEKRHFFLIKDLYTFMYDHTLHRVRKDFCRYCLQAFSTVQILKTHIKECLKINGKQGIIKVNTLNAKIMREQ